MRDKIMKRKKQFHDYSGQFHSMFTLSLNDFWDEVMGFDIVAFEDAIALGSVQYAAAMASPEGASLEWFLTEKYG